MNPRKKACFSLDSFGGFGALQWVTANPNKKILPASGDAHDGSGDTLSPSPLALTGGIRSGQVKAIAQVRFFRNQMSRAP
jgi:hypothetical protein